MVHDARAGIRWTMRQRWLWFGILAAGVANFAAFSPVAVLVPLLVRDVLQCLPWRIVGVGVAPDVVVVAAPPRPAVVAVEEDTVLGTATMGPNRSRWSARFPRRSTTPITA